jgi:hypothetical protein
MIALISVLNVGCVFFGILFAGTTFPSIAVNANTERAKQSVLENPRLTQEDGRLLIQAIQKIEESATHGFSVLEHRRMIQNGIGLVFLLEATGFILFGFRKRGTEQFVAHQPA